MIPTSLPPQISINANAWHSGGRPGPTPIDTFTAEFNDLTLSTRGPPPEGCIIDTSGGFTVRTSHRHQGENHDLCKQLRVRNAVPDPVVKSMTGNDVIVLARDEMEKAIEFRVPIAVDVSVGDNWLKE